MAYWCDEPCPFQLKRSKDGLYYQGVGDKDNNHREEIQATEIIKALNDIALNKDIRGIRICYGRVDGDLNIRDAKKLERFQENGHEYIKLPNEMIFLHTVFDGDVNFRSAQFEGNTSFCSAQFEGNTFFHFAQFKGDTSFRSAQFEGSTFFSEVQFQTEKIDFYYAKFKYLY